MPELMLSRGRVLVGAALLLVVLALAGRFLAAGGATEPAQPLAEARVVRAEPRPALVVHVVGAVRQPGLYRLKEGARVADAVSRAGGARPKADLSLVNLAAPVTDGQQVVVPVRAAQGSAAPVGTAPAAGPVSLSSATVEQLDALPGVGPVTAQKIVEYRERHGAFSSIEELDAISGIGPARLEQLRELVTP
jgi:competence protein ComEA